MGIELSEEALQLLKGLIEKNNNDLEKVARQLFAENYDYRKRNRQLREKVPVEGAVVLSADEAALWEKYKTFGKPEQVQQRLDQIPQLEGRITAVERERQIDQVAQTAGAAAKVLRDRVQATGELVFETRKVAPSEGAEPVETVFVRESKDGSQFVPLKQFATEQWADYVPALFPQQQQPAAQGASPFPPQSGGSRNTAKSRLDKYIEDRNNANKALANPLVKQAGG